MITIEQYREAKQRVEDLHKEQDKLHEKQEKEDRKIDEFFWELERSLKVRENKERKEVQSRHEGENSKIKKRIEPHEKILEQYKRILDFMEISKNRELNSFDVHLFDYPRDEKGEIKRILKNNCSCYPERVEIPYTPIATIKDDKYAKIQVFIVESGKPKNKYSLIVAGNTIFSGMIKDNLWRKYSDHLSWHSNARIKYASIEKVIADKPTEEELKTFFERKKPYILKEFLEQHQGIEREYEEVIKATNTPEWELAYWENKKDYYENHYNRGNETDEYKEVLKNIEKIQAQISGAN